MITRTVRAENMLMALEIIRRELGPEALIVSVRRVLSAPAWQVWRKPLVEVVAVVLEEGEQLDGKNIEPEPLVPYSNKPGMIYKNLAAPRPAPAAPAAPASRDKKRSQAQEGKQKFAGVLEEKGTATQEKLAQAAVRPPAASGPAAVYQRRSAPPPPPPQPASPPPQPEPVVQAPEAAIKPGDTGGVDFSGPLELELPPVLLRAYQNLVRQGLEESFLRRLAKTCVETLNPRALQEEERVKGWLQLQLESCLRVQKESGATPKVICLVGPSGAGKTSVCAKLAVYYSTDLNRKVCWVCSDMVRIGAIAEARTYADTIGVPLELAYTPEELVSQVENAQKQADYILVDTPAFNPQVEESVLELGALLTALPRRHTWMVVPATGKDVNLQSALSVLSPFRVRGLVITKLDETDSFSTAFNLAWHSQLPMTYFSYGLHVLNDLAPAHPNKLVQALFTERFIP